MLPFCRALDEQFEVLIAWRPSSFAPLPCTITWWLLRDPEKIHYCLINMQSRTGSSHSIPGWKEPAKGLCQTLWSRGCSPARCLGPSAATSSASGGASACRLRSSKANWGGDGVIKSWALIQHSHFQKPKLVLKNGNKEKQASGQQVAPEEINSSQTSLECACFSVIIKYMHCSSIKIRFPL